MLKALLNEFQWKNKRRKIEEPNMFVSWGLQCVEISKWCSLWNNLAVKANKVLIKEKLTLEYWKYCAFVNRLT